MNRVFFVAGHDLLALKQQETVEKEVEGGVEEYTSTWLEFRVRALLGEVKGAQVRYVSVLRSNRLEWPHIKGLLEHEQSQFPAGSIMPSRLVDRDRHFKLWYPHHNEPSGEGTVVGWSAYYLPTETVQGRTYGPQIVATVALQIWDENPEHNPWTINARLFRPGSRRVDAGMDILREIAADTQMLQREFPLEFSVRYRPTRGVYIIDQPISTERAEPVTSKEPATSVDLRALQDRFNNGNQPQPSA